MSAIRTSNLERDSFMVIAGWHFSGQGLKENGVVIAKLSVQPLDGVPILN